MHLRILLASCILLLSTSVASAQQKFDVHLQHKVQERANAATKSRVFVNVLMKLQDPSDMALLSPEWCKVNTHLGSVVTAQIDIDHLDKLLPIAEVERVSLGATESPVMDSVKYRTGAWAVQKGWGPIAKARNGKGVLIGIVDTGIDYYHKEFRDKRNPDETRVLFLWNQWDKTGEKPDSFSYGSEYIKKQIDDEINGRANIIPRSDYDPTGRGGDGHGTHVAGIAAGVNGMAPEADLVVVSTDWQSASIIDGVKYIIDKARLLNRPCVINLSLGSQFDLHNGTGLKAEAYEALLNIRPKGTIICAAAGNDGNKNRVWGGFDIESQYGWYYGNPIELAMAIPDSAMSTMSFSITSYEVDYDHEQNYFTIKNELGKFSSVVPSNLTQDSIYSEIKYQDGSLAGSMTAKLNNDPVESDENFVVLRIEDHAEINITKDTPIYTGMELYKIAIRGEGKFYSWLQSVPKSYAGSIVKWVTDPVAVGLDTADGWVGPRNEYSIIAPALYESTFSVGASVNRRVYNDVNGNRKPPAWNREWPGTLGPFSSRGPSVDERTLPEIVAPGMHVFSSIPSWYRGWSDKVLDGTYASSSGTSMAAPVVSGGIALFLEENPDATLDTIRKVFLAQTVEDEFTESNGPLPNNHWGWGKFNITKIMSKGLVYGVDEQDKAIMVYPNPASQFVRVKGDWQSATLTSLSGQVIERWNVHQDWLDVSNIQSGSYLLEIELPEGKSTTKLMVY